MNIGEIANRAALSTKMIRYYERAGLVPPPNRASSGYRVYGENDLGVLVFVKRGRQLGFPIARIRELLALWHDHERASIDVKKMTLAHIASLEATVAGLNVMIDTLNALADACDGNDRPACPIIDDLASPRSAKPAKGRRRVSMAPMTEGER